MSGFKVIDGSEEGVGLTRDFRHLIESTLDPVSRAPFFADTEEIIVTRAPGRLDVMGGIADYSGSLVLQLPIESATYVGLQKNSTGKFRVLSLGTDSRFIEFDVKEFVSADKSPLTYPAARRRFANPGDHWAAYVLGTLLVLMHEKNARFNQGAEILINSQVPEGKGVSSSAALEVAVMQGVSVAFGINVTPQELARLCQRVENLIAGAPCGIMDQMTSACGERNRLLELLCQPDVLKGTLALPGDLELWGIDSGVRHSVGGSDYGTVRTSAFMGYRMIADMAELKATPAQTPGKVEIDDPTWHGYLANISPAEFDTNFASTLPVRLSGAEFLDRYQGITDSVTTVDPSRQYPVRVATKHPIYENARVHSFASILKNWGEEKRTTELGALMFNSHESYSDCGLGSELTDLIVSLVKESAQEGLFGARITGGGSGGTVAVIGRAGAGAAIDNVSRRFQEQTGYQPMIISGSSPGAGFFNHLKLR